MLLRIGNWTKLHQVSFRIVVGTWCVMALVLVNAYSSVLISNLSVPKHQPILQSLEEVAAQHHYKLAVAENTIFANRILVIISSLPSTSIHIFIAVECLINPI